ncbi:uncharacterized protein PV09_03352 [Verruconis gallopava]|uniref:Uncharacterized protein n=1 Tax=Verruconis gallopava TaxID=253628 RepID=A0A0D2AER4_9PEZI|nr:uncharacterized protein PV09_03352 [Verruconis gallopava]KIW05463.1 hypothetical protein PV09_03352 [Verruconis gallopava]
MTQCVACHQPLEVEIELSDDDENVQMSESSIGPTRRTVPDDVYLYCGCHFHWQCLLDSYQLNDCPNCHKTLITTNDSNEQRLLCNLSNEGGLQENLDILPLLTEESYLRAYPEERKARAFLEFCREGDLQAIVDMLRPDSDDEDQDQVHNLDFLWYQDPIGDMQSGLHAAVSGGSREVAWLLLLLASNLDMTQFPPEVLQEASLLGITRCDMNGKVDIRTMRDAQGYTAEELAQKLGGVWHGWAGTGRLAVS